jgi:serine/threonine-protein kinase
VLSLLREHERLPDTVDDRVSAGIARVVADLVDDVKPGDRFGAFTVDSEIGRGGMGAVYLAHRHDGTVDQRVALKVVAWRAGDADARERLARERRLLATLEHPHIARLIDAGEDARGIPYFAMEFVAGETVTAYCDRRRLGIAQRLALFRAICDAVRYAHANLIVHCDLKPGNVLVDANGTPKLLDFGIATTLADTGETAQPERRFFSPYAAAPEQIAGAPGSVAMDVYALGALLYELLSGARASNAKSGNCENDTKPIPPSIASTAHAAAARATTVAALRRRLRGDLDRICLKALENAPARRYATVEALDGDIGLHVHNRPIAARAGEAGYRLRKFLRRNALASLFVTVLVGGAMIFAAVTLQQNRRLADERDQTAARERQALFERARAEQVTDFLIGLFKAADPAQAGRDVTARELLARGTRRLDTELAAQPALRATLLAAVSDIYLALDDLDHAQQTAEAASALRTAQGDTAAQAASLRQLAALANSRGHAALAAQTIERALTLAPPGDSDERANMLAVKATAFEGLAKPDDAIALWRELLARETRVHGEDDLRTLRAAVRLATALRARGFADESATTLAAILPRERRSLAANDPRVAETLLDLAVYARNKGRFDEARGEATESLAIYRAIYGKDNSSFVASAANTLATIEQARGEYASAQSLFAEALAIKRAIYGDNNPRIASAEYNVGLLALLRLHDLDTAEPHLRAAVAIGEKTLDPAHANLANYRLALGSTLRERGRYAEAETLLRQSLTTFEAQHAPQGIDIGLANGELLCLRAVRARQHAAPELDAVLERLATIDADDPQVQRLAQCRAAL